MSAYSFSLFVVPPFIKKFLFPRVERRLLTQIGVLTLSISLLGYGLEYFIPHSLKFLFSFLSIVTRLLEGVVLPSPWPVPLACLLPLPSRDWRYLRLMLARCCRKLLSWAHRQFLSLRALWVFWTFCHALAYFFLGVPHSALLRARPHLTGLAKISKSAWLLENTQREESVPLSPQQPARRNGYSLL